MKETSERKLDLGDGYWLCNDKYCWWIMKEYEAKSGKNKGKVTLKNLTGYHPTVESAFLDLSEYHTRTFDVKSIKSLIKEVKSLKSSITRMIGAINGQV